MQTQADYISSAFPGIGGHAITLLTAKKALGYTAALTKSILHGIVRGAINVIQSGGKFLSSFASGFVSSAFSVGKRTFGEGAIAARTAIMALVGGVTSSLTGGKFLNGAVSAAFVHLFNAEDDWWKSLDSTSNMSNDEVYHIGPYQDDDGTIHIFGSAGGKSRASRVYSSIKRSPEYPQGFRSLKNGTTFNKVKNQDKLVELRSVEAGKWNKVYKDGFVGSKPVSLHYFQSQSGQIVDFKIKWEHMSNGNY